MPVATNSPPSETLVGRTEPRLFTEPLRPLTRETTRGYEVIDFAEHVLGEPLLPHQAWLAKHGLELLPDGRYRFRTIVSLQARQNGKTTLLRTIALWRLYIDGATLVLGTAQDRTIALESWRACLEAINNVPELRSELDYDRRTVGDEHFRLLGGGRYMIRASNGKAARGLSVDLLIMDEIREQRDSLTASGWATWSALSKTTIARPQGQIWAISNAGDDSSVVLNQLRDAALSGHDPSIGLFEWSAPDGCELDDTDAWTQANPGLGYTISPTAIRSALATDPPEVFRTEVLCQRVDALDSAIDQSAWKACRDTTGNLNYLRDRVALCVDVSPDSEHVTLAAAALTDDGRPRGEIVAAWSGTDDARDDLNVWLNRVRPIVVGWYPSGPGGVFAPVLRPHDLKAEEKLPAGWRISQSHRGRAYVELTGTRVTEACQGLADLAVGRRVLHPDDPLLNMHVAGAVRLESGDGWRFARRGTGHVDAAYAFAGAVQLAQLIPAQARPKIRMVS